MATLFDIMLQAHTKMGTIRFDTSSGGSTVAVNSQTYSSAHSDDDFNNGTMFIIESTNAGTTSINGQFRRISDYDASSGQFTLSSALSTAVTAGTRFGYTTPEFPHELVSEIVNQSLQSIGPFTFTNRAIVSSANQRVYSLSSVAKYSEPLLVEVMGRIGSSADDPRWSAIYDWKIRPSTAGAAILLEIGHDIPVTRDVRVWYDGHHHRITDSTSVIDERIHPELAALVLVEKLYEYRNSLNRGSVEFDLQRWNDAKRQAAEAKVRWPFRRGKRRAKLNIVGDKDDRGGDRAPWPPPYGPS